MRIGKSVGHGDMPIEVWKSEKDQQWKSYVYSWEFEESFRKRKKEGYLWSF